MKSLRKTFSIILAISLIAILVTAVIWTVKLFFNYLSAVPKELAAALVAGIATVLVATLTVMVGRYYERKKELDALYRDKKTEIYDEFLREFFKVYFAENNTNDGKSENDLVPFFREFTRKLILWSGPSVIESFVAWKDHLAKGEPDAKSIFLTESFLLSIRNDLRHSNAGLRRGFFARLFLKQSELFLFMAAKNENVTLAEIAVLEKAIKESNEPAK